MPVENQCSALCSLAIIWCHGSDVDHGKMTWIPTRVWSLLIVIVISQRYLNSTGACAIMQLQCANSIGQEETLLAAETHRHQVFRLCTAVAGVVSFDTISEAGHGGGYISLGCLHLLYV